MENAVKALEYAFAILVFVIGLSSSIYLLSEVKTTSDIVFSYVDTKQFYEDAKIPDDELENPGTDNEKIKFNGRIVSVDTIVPTIYRYFNENYIVEFYEKKQGEQPEKLIIKFDLSAETTTRQLWTAASETGKKEDAKKRLDYFLSGRGSNAELKINSNPYDMEGDIAFQEDFADKNDIVQYGLYNFLKEKKFSEEYAYVPETPEGTIGEEVTRMVIRYKEI